MKKYLIILMVGLICWNCQQHEFEPVGGEGQTRIILNIHPLMMMPGETLPVKATNAVLLPENMLENIFVCVIDANQNIVRKDTITPEEMKKGVSPEYILNSGKYTLSVLGVGSQRQLLDSRAELQDAKKGTDAWMKTIFVYPVCREYFMAINHLEVKGNAPIEVDVSMQRIHGKVTLQFEKPASVDVMGFEIAFGKNMIANEVSVSGELRFSEKSTEDGAGNYFKYGYYSENNGGMPLERYSFFCLPVLKEQNRGVIRVIYLDGRSNKTKTISLDNLKILSNQETVINIKI